MVKVLLSPGKESSLTHIILEGSAQILHSREVVVEFGQEKTLSLNACGSSNGKNQIPMFQNKKIICRAEKTETYDESIYLTNNKETVQS